MAVCTQSMLEFSEMRSYFILEQFPVDEGGKDYFKDTTAVNTSLKIRDRLRACTDVGLRILVEAIKCPVISEQWSIWKLQKFIRYDQFSLPFSID